MDRILHVRRVVCRGGRVYIKSTKTERGLRDVPIAIGLAEVLRAHLRAQDERMAMLDVEVTEKTFLYDRYDGQLWHPDAFGKSYRLFIANNGLPKLKLHGTRHSFDSMGMTEGIHPKVMSAALGHESEILTPSVYTHVDKMLIRDAAEQIDSAISRSRSSHRMNDGYRPGCSEDLEHHAEGTSAAE